MLPVQVGAMFGWCVVPFAICLVVQTVFSALMGTCKPRCGADLYKPQQQVKTSRIAAAGATEEQERNQKQSAKSATARKEDLTEASDGAKPLDPFSADLFADDDNDDDRDEDWDLAAPSSTSSQPPSHHLQQSDPGSDHGEELLDREPETDAADAAAAGTAGATVAAGAAAAAAPHSDAVARKGLKSGGPSSVLYSADRIRSSLRALSSPEALDLEVSHISDEAVAVLQGEAHSMLIGTLKSIAQVLQRPAKVSDQEEQRGVIIRQSLYGHGGPAMITDAVVRKALPPILAEFAMDPHPDVAKPVREATAEAMLQYCSSTTGQACEVTPSADLSLAFVFALVGSKILEKSAVQAGIRCVDLPVQVIIPEDVRRAIADNKELKMMLGRKDD